MKIAFERRVMMIRERKRKRKKQSHLFLRYSGGRRGRETWYMAGVTGACDGVEDAT